MDPAEEAAIQQMLLSMLTNREPEPVQETSPLTAARGATVNKVMSDPWVMGGKPAYRVPTDPAEVGDAEDLEGYRRELGEAEHEKQEELRQREYERHIDQLLQRFTKDKTSVGGPPPMPTEWVPDPEIYPPMASNEQLREQGPFDAARGAKAAEMMSSSFWGDAPMYATPASSYGYTDEGVHQGYLDRLANDAERQAEARHRDIFYDEAWQQGIDEDDRHPDRAFPPGTPPYYRLPQRATR